MLHQDKGYMMENESEYINNVFNPNIDMSDYCEGEPTTTNEIATHIAIAVHNDAIGGDFIVSKLSEDDSTFAMISYQTGMKYKVTVEKME